MSLLFDCEKCGAHFSSTEKLRLHLLFTHFTYMETCSTGIIEKQHVEQMEKRKKRRQWRFAIHGFIQSLKYRWPIF